MKSDKDFFHEIAPLIKPSYFESPFHENLFKAISEHKDEYGHLPSDDVILEAVKTIKSDEELMVDYKDELSEINGLDIKSISSKEYYLDLVEDFAKKQAIQDAFLRSITYLKKGEIGRIEHEMKIALSVSRNLDLGIDYKRDFFERWGRNYDNKGAKIETGLYTLDGCLDGGVGKKELALVVAPPGVGKSLFLTHLGTMAILQGLNILHVTLEMSEDKVAQRYDSNLTAIPQDKLKESKEDVHDRLDELFENIEKKAGKRPSLKIKEFPTGQLNVHGLRAYLTQLRNFEEFIPDLIIVDYMELMRPTTPGMAEYQAQERIAQELRGVASEYDLLLWTATQTNRDGRRVPLISDTELADAYGKTRTCDLALSINQTSEEFDEGKARIYVFKSRNSKTKFVVNVKIDYNLLTVREI